MICVIQPYPERASCSGGQSHFPDRSRHGRPRRGSRANDSDEDIDDLDGAKVLTSLRDICQRRPGILIST